ncbi:MAG: hypothetical protein KDC98_11835, partial [Planctomycetes bacterium]|nr:hypothetical protein [Planctomycetota bacterium]
MRTVTSSVFWICVVVLSASACSDLFGKDGTPLDIGIPDVTLDVADIADVTVDPTAGKVVGEACDAAAVVPECRYGLSCEAGTCQTSGDSPENRPCILTAECAAGLYCGLAGVCQPAGEGTVGADCSRAGD